MIPNPFVGMKILFITPKFSRSNLYESLYTYCILAEKILDKLNYEFNTVYECILILLIMSSTIYIWGLAISVFEKHVGCLFDWQCRLCTWIRGPLIITGKLAGAGGLQVGGHCLKQKIIHSYPICAWFLFAIYFNRYLVSLHGAWVPPSVLGPPTYNSKVSNSWFSMLLTTTSFQLCHWHLMGVSDILGCVFLG